MSLGPNVLAHSELGAILQSLSSDKDYEREFNSLYDYTHTDTGIKSARSDARLKMYGTGDIELLTTEEVGMYVSSDNKSISLNGAFGHMYFDDLLFTTKEDGLLWNGYILNPMLRLLCSDEYDLKLIGKDKNGETIEISPFIKKERKESEDLSKVLKNRGRFINYDLDDYEIVKHIIESSEVVKTEYEFYDEEGE